MPDDRNTAGEQQKGQANPTRPLTSTATQSGSDPKNPHGGDVQNTSCQEPQETKWFHSPDWHMVWLTGLLFVVGIITAVIFYRQFSEMQKQTGILNDQAKQAASDSIEAARRVERQLDLAQKQVSAAQDSVNAIKQQMRQDQRPWLDIEFGDIIWKENQPLTVSMTLVNRGKTPAKNIDGGAFVEKIVIHERPHFGRLVSHFGTGMLVPNFIVSGWGFYSAQSTHIPVKMSTSDIRELDAGRAIAVVHGTVTFDDIFGIHHWIKFCSYTPNRTFVANVEIQDTAGPCINYKNTDSN